MKNKGFTLTEILAVIVIISLLLLIIAPPIMNKLKGNKEITKESQNKLLEEATDQFTNANKEKYPSINNSTYCISLKALIANGFLNENIKDVTTKEKFSDTTSIKLTIDEGGNRTYEISNSASCKEKHNKSSITFEVSPGNDTWSKNKKVIIHYPKLDEYAKNYQIFDGAKTVTQNFDQNLTITQEIKDDEEKYITAEIAKRNENDVTATQRIRKIDNTPPTVTLNVTSTNDNYNTLKINYTLTSTDAISGVNKYCISANGKCNPNITYPSSDVTKTNVDLGFNNLDGKNKTITACTSDKAGNIACANKTYTLYKECDETTSQAGSWGGCTASCGGGSQYRDITHKDKYTGEKCRKATESQSCNTQSCHKYYYTCRSGKTCINKIADYRDCSWTVGQGYQIEISYCTGGYCVIQGGTHNGRWIKEGCFNESGSCSYSSCQG